MPLYEYQCAKCGVFEVIRKFSDEPLTVCPTCGGAIQKLASAPAFHLKGTGWYATDYAKKSGGEGKSGSGKSEEGKSGSGDAKPADGKTSESKSGDSGKSSKDATATTSATATKKTG